MAMANVVSSRLVSFVRSSETRPSVLESISNRGPTPECREAVQRALILSYSQDPSILSFPDLIRPEPLYSLETNIARAETVYTHSACSSAFRRKDPRVVIEEHEAVARGTGRVECPGSLTVDGAEPWWATVFGDKLAGLYATYGPFLSRQNGGSQFFTLWGDQVCEVLFTMAEGDPNPSIRLEAAQAYFSPIRTQRVRSGANVGVVFLCPEELVGEDAPPISDFDARPAAFLHPTARLKIAVTGPSQELREVAAFAAAKALADLQTLSQAERTRGVGHFTREEERELLEFLTGERVEYETIGKERALHLLASRGRTAEAKLAGGLALGMTWADMIKAHRRSDLLGEINENSLLSFWHESRSPHERKTIIAPLACLFADPGEVITNFTIHGESVIGLPDLSC